MGGSYSTRKDRRSGKRRRAHRLVAEEMLGRQLLPGEVVHHRDGHKSNNLPENLLVLPSQACHASLEFHLRRQKSGMACLFPELLLFESPSRPLGTLWDGQLVLNFPRLTLEQSARPKRAS